MTGRLVGRGGQVQLLERLERIARARDPRVRQVMATLASEYDVILVARSDGLIASDVRPLVRMSLDGESQSRPGGASKASRAVGGRERPRLLQPMNGCRNTRARRSTWRW